MKEFFTSNDWLGRTGPFTNNLEYLLFYLGFFIFGVALVCILAHKKNPKATKIVLIVLWGINVFVDMLKLYALQLDGEFNVGGDMLLYICSLFLYAMPFALWGKGKLKDIACTFICTIGVFGALMNFVVPGVVDTNSLFSFWGLHTTIYHLNLFLVPAIMLITGYHKLKWKDFGWAFLGFVVLTIPALFFNFMADTDWMYLRVGNGLPFPFVPALVEKIGGLWTLIAYAGYAAIQAIMLALFWGIDKLVVLIKTKIQNNKAKKQLQEEPVVEKTTMPEEQKAEVKN